MNTVPCDLAGGDGPALCATCGLSAFDNQPCPLDGLDPDLLNVKTAAVCVLGTPSDNEECVTCQ